jgi:ABC-type methionine transport system ATPase subunit
VSDAPWIEIIGVTKAYQGLRPLRIARFTLGRGDRVALSGFDRAAAEVFVHLITGASVPDEGLVRVAGRDTRDIATDTEWLASLDRFGIITERAVLLEGMTVAANLALPLTLAIDPMSAEVRARVEALASDVGLAPGRLGAPASTLSAEERLHVHFARALGVGPDVLLLEHPTARLDPAGADSFARTLKAVSAARGLSWVVLTEDDRFARATGGTRLRLKPATGELTRGPGFWKNMLSG